MTLINQRAGQRVPETRVTNDEILLGFERIVLGYALSPINAPHAAAEIKDIDPAHFLMPAHEHVFASIKRHVGHPDIQMRVTAELIGVNAHRALNALEQGIPAFITECVAAADCLDADTMRFYAAKVRNAFVRRRGKALLDQTASAFMNDDFDAVNLALLTFADLVGDRPATEESSAPQYGDIATMLTQGLPDPPQPEILHRQDKVALFYRSKVNVLFGDPECGKTWIALAAIVEVLNSGGKGAFLDLDHNGQEEVVARLLLLGAHPARLGDLDRFRYCEPEDAIDLEWFAGDVASWRPDLAVVDSLGELLPMLGLSSNSPDDFTAGNRKVLTRLANSGAAVVAIDHLPKDEGARAQGQTGTMAKKRAANGASLRVTAKDQFTPGHGGSANISIHKDRPGGLRRHSPPGKNTPAGRFVMVQRGEIVEWLVTRPLTESAATPQGASTEDVAKVLNLPKEARTKRKIQDHFGWGSDRAHRTLQKVRELGEGGDEE